MSFRIWVSVWTSSADSNFFYIIIKTQKDGVRFQISIKVQSFLKHCVKWRSCKTLYWTLERLFQKRLNHFFVYKIYLSLLSLFWWLWKWKKVWRSYLQFKSQTVSDKSLISDPPNFASDTHWKQKPEKFFISITMVRNLSVVVFWFSTLKKSSSKNSSFQPMWISFVKSCLD